jgi:hypothetical protein
MCPFFYDRTTPQVDKPWPDPSALDATAACLICSLSLGGDRLEQNLLQMNDRGKMWLVQQG